jgi:Tol biopolymer transport system component
MRFRFGGCVAACAVLVTATGVSPQAGAGSAPVVGAEARSGDGSASTLGPGLADDGAAFELSAGKSREVSVGNGRIAYARYREVGRDARVDIYTVRPDGSGTRRLTLNRTSSMPQWSPRGGRIAFRRDSGGNPWVGRFEIVVMGAGGTNKRVLATGRSNGRFVDIAWSPNGRRIVYTTLGKGSNSRDIWVVRARTGDAKVLIGGAADQSGPVWSPDGTRIAYESAWSGTGDNYQGQVFVHAVETGESTPVTPPSPDPGNGPHGGQPAWSPDGVSLAYARYRDFEDGSYIQDFDLAVVRADGTGDRLVSRGARDEEHPDWRSQGGRLLFTTGFHGGYPFPPEAHGIVTIRPDGTDRRRISATGETSAGWSPDGRRIVAIRPLNNGEGTNKRPGVWVLHPSGERTHRVATGDIFFGVDWQPRFS